MNVPSTPPAAPQARPKFGGLVEDWKRSSGLEKGIYSLLLFIPLAFLAEFLGWGATAIFFLSCLAIIPLAKVMGTATEELASRTSQGVGGLLNATFGNAVELIIAIAALINAHENPRLIEVVKASLTGSVIGNLLFVLGFSFLLGGFKHKTQQFNRTAASATTTQMTLAAVGLILPAVFAFALATSEDAATRSQQRDLLEGLSLGVAALLIVSYLGSLIFSLGTHKFLYNEEEEDEMHGSDWSVAKSLIVLLVATVLVGFLAEFLTGSVEALTTSLGWSELFVGVVIIAIVGNAAEHLTAVTVAMKNKMSLSISIAIGSSTQVALFVAPVLVFVGFFLGGNSQINLVFSSFELISIIVAVVITQAVASDGESNWLEGLQLVIAYLIIVLAFYLFPSAVPTIGER